MGLQEIDNYMREARNLLKTRKSNTKEFRQLIKAIEEESLLLTPIERSNVLDKFFTMWDKRN